MDQLSFIPINLSRQANSPGKANSLDRGIYQPPPRRISRDEMNLAEFPLTVLSTRADSSTKTLEFKDSIRSRNGELIERTWIITGADKFGLPTSSDDEVLLGLLKLSVEEGFRAPKVYFTRYELLKILRWTTEGRSYSRLQKALDRLSGVRIKATNAFYDNESKSHNTRNFGLIDAYEINDGRSTAPKPSFFIWSEVLFKSFQVGFIKKFDLDFYLNLKSAVSKRLFRYLDKHFWYKSKIQIKVFVLAHEKIGISRNYVYSSSLRQQLDPALEELKEKGFISSYDFYGKGQDCEVCVYAGSLKPRVQNSENKLSVDEVGEVRIGKQNNFSSSHSTIEDEGNAPSVAIDFSPPSFFKQGVPENEKGRQERDARLKNSMQDTPGDFESPDCSSLSAGNSPNEAGEIDSATQSLAQLLLERGIRQPQIKKLLQGRSLKILQKMGEIVRYYDYLRATKSRLISRSPVGFLYRAIEHPENFVLPGISPTEPPTLKSATQAELPLSRRNSAQLEVSRAAFITKDERSRTSSLSQSAESDYLIARKREIEKLKQDVEPGLLQKIKLEVEKALLKVKDLISETRFSEVVQHGVEEKLADLFAIPTFEEWLKQRSRL